MTPPINIDGTQITGASIDGQDVSAITVDGTPVFTAIPDSVVMQHFATTYAASDSIWIDDATTDGAQDVSITGNPQKTTLSDGSESISFDSNDHGTVTMPSQLNGSGLRKFAYEVSFEYSNNNVEQIVGGRNSNSQQNIELVANVDGDFNNSNGDMISNIVDDSGQDKIRFGIEGENLNDGKRHDLSIIYNDTTANSLTVILDGATKTVNVTESNGPDNFTTWDSDIGYGVFNDSGSTSRSFTGELAAFRWHDKPITQQTINAYP